MGEIHETMTARQLCENKGIAPDTMRMRFAKLRETMPTVFNSAWRIDGELTTEQMVRLIEAGERKGGAPKEIKSEAVAHTADIPMRPAQGQPNGVAPQGFEAKKSWRVRIFISLAFTIVMGHSLLIWWDLAHLWKVPGMIGGGVVFAFILSGMVLMSEKSESMAEIRENMLWAVGLLESLAIVVHQAAFYRSAGEAYLAGLGLGYTWALAAVICCCSIAATIFYQKVISK